MKRTQGLLILLLILLAATPLAEPVLGVIQPLGAATFPSGTYVVPMDNKQADRIHVYGFIHEFLKNSTNNNLARIIEPPDATLQTALTPSGEVYQGGPFLIEAGFSSGVNLILSNSTFSKVTVTKLTAPFTSNRVFFVRSPTKILVISDGFWGKTFLTLQRMGISYDQVSTAQIAANASLINQYTLIVLDSPGWYGTPSKYDPAHQAEIEAVYNTMRVRVQTGAEVMYTDAAILDMNSTFPGYVNLSLGGESGSWHSTVYNAPKGNSFESEFPSQYYNPPPNPNNVKILTEEGAGLWVPTSIPSAHTQDVRILMDTVNYGIPSKYAILAFYFPFGRGIVEGLALQPYEQLYPNYADQNGYYATYEIYGNKFVEGLGQDFTLAATPNTETVSQGQTASYSVTVTSLSEFSSAVNLQVTGGLPPGTQASIVPSSVTPSPDGSVVATLTIPTSLSTPVGSYNVTITGSSSLPLITRSIVVGMIVAPAVADFTINVGPSLVVINRASCGNYTVTVTSLGNFSSPINLTLSGIPEHVTWKYVPNPITPPVGGTVVSVLSVCTEANTPPGNYTITILATGGGQTHTATALLRVPTPPVPSVNWLIYVLILGMLLLALGIALLAFFLSRKGPRRVRLVRAPAPVPVGVPVMVRLPPRAAYVLPLPTVRCRYCGRIMPLTSVYCPFCGRPQVVLAPPPVRYARRGLGRNGLLGVILTLISGILVLLNSAALLSPSFYAFWSTIFFWLPAIGPPAYAFAIGVIIGLTLIFGAIVMAMGHGAIADVIIFPFAVFSLIIGGGFIAGFILGVLGGIFGALSREP